MIGKKKKNTELKIIICGFFLSVCLFFWVGKNPDRQLEKYPFIQKNQVNPQLLESGFYTENEPVIKSTNKYQICLNDQFPQQICNIESTAGIKDIIPSLRNKLMLIITSPVWRAPLNTFKKAISLRIFDVHSDKVYYRTYFNFKHNTGLPVLAVTINQKDVFDPVKGIFVQGIRTERSDFNTKWWDLPGNYQVRGSESKVDCFFEFFDTTGTIKYSSFCDLRINGNATRAFPQKSLRLTASKNYGNKSFRYPFFSNSKNAGYRSLVLRNGGNDWGRTYFSDALMQFLVKDMHLETQDFKPLSLYINGEYWGLYYLRERVDENYLADKYKVSKKKVVLLEADELKNGDINEFNDLKNTLDRCLEKKETSGIEKLGKHIDIENFINYLVAEIYFANLDWPSNNTKLYKLPGEKWKFILYDLDYGYGYTGMPEAINTDMFAVLARNKNITGKIYNVLMRDKNFKVMLRSRFEEIMKNELDVKRQLKFIESFSRNIEMEIPLQIKRWRKPYTFEEWKKHVDTLKDFAKQRKNVIQRQLKNYFDQ